MQDQTRLRDIGEMTFGRRKPRKPADDGVLGVAAASVLTTGRQQVPSDQIGLPPFRNICDLRITAANGTEHSGTAWFISPRTLVTAGHCLFVFNPDHTIHGMIRSVRVMPARRGEFDEQHSLFGWVDVDQENLVIHPRWEAGGELDFDYGAIRLPEPFAGLPGANDKFNFGDFTDQDLLAFPPTLSGYPDGVPEGTQWVEVNSIEQVTSHRVFYSLHTEQGQSGSPVFYRNGGENIACAIHHFGDTDFNAGVRINADVVAQLNEWSTN
jgi:glutamyl endopeptidase